jgi:tetratricopeptide (TPR) repeat protein
MGPAPFIATWLSDRWDVLAARLEAIGNAHRALGEYERAATALHEALELRKQHMSPDHEDIASSLHSLGTLYHQRGRWRDGDYVKAKDYYGRALRMRRRTLATDSLPYCTTRFHQAWLAAEMEEYDRAATLFQQVIEIRERTESGKADRLTIRAQMGLAGINMETGGPLQYLANLPPFVEGMKKLGEVAKD